ncbi:MAG: RagB/SusD family nutrient uptake outer membrane protein [Cellulophaga sp.]|uniref:RagB/SusD family nutrient uptake outer membrane protein n=1 Tax=Cellulophaga sp. TaxID=1972202 RepID=UPI003263301A
MKKYIIIIVLIATGVFQSCSDYLEETNPNFLSSDTYWRTLEESESNLTSLYGGMLDHNILGLEEEFYRTDLAHPGPRNNPTGAYLPWYQHRLTFDNPIVQKRWDSKYRVIWRANQVIEGLNSMTDDLKSKKRWTEQMAQARFFRGLMHFYLHSTFNEGKIIIRESAPKSNAEYSKALSTSEEVIAFFTEDLEYAYNNLPLQMEPKSRVDAGAAATILGTSYLYRGEYDKASTYFNDIINNVRGDYGYELEQDISKMFTTAGEFNSESIFEINYANDQQLEDGFFNEESFNNRLARRTAPTARHAEEKLAIGGQAQLLPSAWLTYAYSTEPMDTQDPRNYIDGDITGTLKTIPLRASQTIAVVNDELSEYYGYVAPQTTTFGNTRFSNYKKYTNHIGHITEFETSTSPWKSGRNIVVNRLSGVYLMQAECMLNAGNVSGALNLVNQIRQRWGLQLLGMPDGSAHDFDGVTYSSSSLMEHLMYKEYPLELSLEGFSTRTIDLRRWGVTLERFQDLSTQVFSVADYTYIRTNGKEAVRKQSLLQTGNGPKKFSEYIDAASAWSAGQTGYFDIPQGETLNNNKLNN